MYQYLLGKVSTEKSMKVDVLSDPKKIKILYQYLLGKVSTSSAGICILGVVVLRLRINIY